MTGPLLAAFGVEDSEDEEEYIRQRVGAALIGAAFLELRALRQILVKVFGGKEG